MTRRTSRFAEVERLTEIIPKTCPCGSGLLPTLAHDTRLIPLGLVCDRCEAAKLSQYF